jgi:EmrB/QacA subfamily drug resistance transporter
MIAVALLDIEHDLDVGVAAVTWLVSGYLIAMAIVQPLGGRLGDALGHRHAFLGGLIGFLALSAAAAAAPWLWALVALRIGQAVAGGLMMPNAQALLRDAVPFERRGRLFGWFGTGMGLAAAVGPVVGGGLVAALGWRAIFLVNLPIGLAALAAAAASLPRAEAARPRSLRLDVPGAAAFTAAVGGLVAALYLAPDGPSRWAPAALVTVVVLVVLVAVERRVADPFISPGLFRERAYVSATVTVALHNLAMYSLLLVVPVLADRRLGLGEGQAGLLVGTMTAAMMVAAPIGGHLADRFGRRVPALAGSLFVAVATGLLAMVVTAPAVAPVAGLIGLVGLGVGLAGASLQTTAVEAVPAGAVALAGGVFMTMRYTGGIAAAGLAAAVADGDAFAAGAAVVAVAAALSLISAAGLPGREAAGVRAAPAS